MIDYRTEDEINLVRQCRIAIGAQLLRSEAISEIDAARIAKYACHRGHSLAYAILEAEHADRRTPEEVLREIEERDKE